MKFILETLSQKLYEIFGREVKLELSKRPEHGDLFTTIAFQIGKEEGRSAREVADELVKEIDLNELKLVEKVENVNGYINFFLKRSNFAELVLREVLEKREAYGSLGKQGRIVVEHTSANPVHPIHIGTLRCAVIGDTLARVLVKAGYEVEVQNYVNDLGRQVAILLLGLERYKGKRRGEKFDHHLGSIYIKANAEVEQNPQLEEKVREILLSLESLSGKYHEMKEKVVPRCVRAMLQTLWKFNIFFDLLIFERDLVKRSILRKTIERMLLSDKVFEVMEGEDRGCLAIDMSDCQALVGDTLKKYKIIRRSDGTITYEGKDIAYQLWKFGIITGLHFSPFAKQPNEKLLLASDSGEPEGERKIDRVINVVGFEQKYSQLVVFNALRILGFEEEFRNSIHLPFEWVCFEKGGEVEKISGRRDHLLEYSADTLFEKVYEAAKLEVQKKNPNASEKAVRRVAKKVAVGAIRFYLLKFDLDKKIVFDIAKALSFEGESGVYLQYAALRAKKILEKLKSRPKQFNANVFNEEELSLIKKIAEYPLVIEEISNNYQVNSLASYALELAKKFNEFYNRCPVMKAGGEIRKARINLVRASYLVLRDCLGLMGIDVPEFM